MQHITQFFDLPHIGALWFIVDWTIRIGALFVVPRNRKPSSGTAWLLLIFFFPLFGLLLFIILGNPKLPKNRQAAQKTLDKIIQRLADQLRSKDGNAELLSTDVPQKYQHIAKLSETLSKLAVTDGNRVEVLPDYDIVLQKLAQDIDQAKHYVVIEYFIIVLDDATKPVFDAVARAVQRGVIVRVLYDSLSTKRYKTWKQTLGRLQADGVIIQPMLPLKMPGKGYVRPDLRNHRKLVVIDGAVGYTGSLNLVQRDYHRKDDIYYDELVVRVAGPAALQLGAVFMTDWYSETGKLLTASDVGLEMHTLHSEGDSKVQVLPSGPGYEDENNLKLFTSLIHTARENVTIVNPYFVPDDALINAITSAAKRGVKVTMINSAAMDQWMVGHAQRSFYQMMLEAGVDIYLYREPILLHSKFMTIDGSIATIGSSNLDIRSFYLNLEVTMICYDPQVVKKLEAVEQDYLKRADKVDIRTWKKRSRKAQLLDNIARLTAALQ